ncbi:hypothetical protein RHGRI_031503 [Rhododendron griersonianum]|uniref:C2 domain-containing protein n=1 Tax=Rhododendron griersonianum TaxID=479676 RepID=A0AAV6IDY5_9ERIC|nr:hypothetical protein RHGRI_031503 [Rhododendron griersonianum]
MAKLVVEVLDASDLMPKDGQGSSSPFVEVDFDQQRQRTQTKPKDLNPQWNQPLVFSIADPSQLPNKTLDVVVYNDRKGADGHHKNFLGRVRISGWSVPPSESQAAVQRYPLDKRGLFSHIKGDIALKIYVVEGPQNQFGPQSETQNSKKFENGFENREAPSLFEENNAKKVDERDEYKAYEDEYKAYEDENKKQKSKKKEKEVRTFHSVGTGPGPAPAPAPGPPPVQATDPVPRTDYAQAGGGGPGPVFQMQGPGMRPEFGLTETRPPLAARMGYRTGDKTASTYDMVEKMHYLYVSVVKARDLPVMDLSGSLDPYVEVKLGNYKGVTKHLDKNQSPVWNKIFAFPKENLQSNVIEVTVKDKDIGKDDFVGSVFFDITDIPIRVPPDSPLAPQWYKLENRKGERVNRGEIMLAVWMGTQADEAFPEAWHSDAHDISQQSLTNTRSKVYFSPKLYYLRVHVIAAQDLVPGDNSRMPDPVVKVHLGHQLRVTRPSRVRHVNTEWDEELMFVASEPFDEFMVISVEDRIGPGKDEVLGRLIVPVREIPHRMDTVGQRMDTAKIPEARWFNLLKPSVAGELEGEKKKEAKFSSKIYLRLWLDGGYHVLDESTHFSSDLQPSSKHLRKASIGILELGILSARNLLPMKSGGMTDAYCVAKYGNKWVRTRTLLNTLHPRWNEQYSWEVHDPCTVITIGVFDNWHVNGSREDGRDQRIGKVRVRLSTLETNRIYTHFYPLLVLTPSGLKKHGELHLALRFTCTAWVNMVAQYSKPLLPKMHYVQPIPIRHIDWLRHQAMQIVAARLARAEPPLRREIVEYMLDVDIHMWSLRRSKATFHRIMSLLSGVFAVCRWFNDVCMWRNPITTCLVHVLFLILVCYPELILPTIFLYLFVIGLWNYRFRPRTPPHMDARMSQAENAHPDELDEEFDTFPTSRQPDMVRMRYDRLRSVSGRIQTVVGDLATQGERVLSILNWRDPRATAIVIIISLCLAVFLYVTPFQVVAVLIGLYLLRHPRFRSKMPSVPVNFFKRLPAKSDMLL